MQLIEDDDDTYIYIYANAFDMFSRMKIIYSDHYIISLVLNLFHPILENA